MKISKAMVCLLFGGLILTGCSSLNVRVSVYDGPMADPLDSRLASALGIAEAIRAVSDDLVQGEDAPGSNYSELLANITGYHETLGLKGTGSATDRAGVAVRLVAFSDQASTIAQRVGHYEFQRALRWEMFGPSLFELPNAELINGVVVIDEGARIIKGLASSVIAELEHIERTGDGEPSTDVFLGQINSIMSSQAPGTLLTVIQNDPRWWKKALGVNAFVREIYDQRYWKEINNIPIRTVGKSAILLVKDDVGNWQIKHASIDPSAVTEAATAVTVRAIKAYLATP